MLYLKNNHHNKGHPGILQWVFSLSFRGFTVLPRKRPQIQVGLCESSTKMLSNASGTQKEKGKYPNSLYR